jgi:PAS domain S-box-containing protein
MARKKGKRRTAPERPKAGETERAEPIAAAPAPSTGEAAEPRFPVVGIGASAGGLEAFRKFFSTMPADSGLAFVLIPHLDPSHASLMVDLLARSTAMPVVEAEEDMAVEADRVFILPPNKYMTIGDGKLHLTGPVQRGGLPTSIDLFLRSLAEDRQEQAVGIVLSGTGAHGTLGLKAIKANGGMAMVQDPGTAEYDSMPRSAIATGHADYILPPEQMPQALIRYVQHFFDTSARAAEAVEEAHLDPLLVLLRSRAELDFRYYRKKTLLRRVRRRMGLHHIDRISEYLAFLRGHPKEVARLAKDLLISVTGFFRDREVFQALQGQVIPQLVRARNADESLRVWVPGCATGEEAYSIAMLLMEHLASAQKTCRLQVFATDVAEDALEVARRGCYPESITADVSAERLGRFFLPTDGHSYQVNKQLREAITFAAQNVLGDAPFSKLDLISCRNLLIYLEPEVQQKVVKLFHFALREEGYLLLGPSETVGQQADLFEAVSKKWRVYRRIGPSRAEYVDFPILAGGERHGASRRVPSRAGTRPAGSSAEQLETELRATRGELRKTIGKLASSNEDLKASNEEMMSMNEELQAANEELETSKEEMQTLNEELSAVNSQLQDKVAELRAANNDLRRLAAVLIDSNDAITVHDLQGRITAWNRGGERMYGYTEAEALQMNVEQLLPEELRPDADGLLGRLRRGERVDSLETRRLTKDGRIIDVWLTATPLRDDAGQIIAAALTERNDTLRKALEREVLEIAALEQRRIGHDLHDTVGQELTALGLMADSLVAALRDNSPTDVPLAVKIAQALRRTLGQIRALARGLVPVEVDAHGLMAALAELTARVNRESGVRCTFACADSVPVRDNATATHLYHIAQEAVSNALKHGEAKHIQVALGLADGLLTLTITDDGVGIRNERRKDEGLGLRIMRYRADLIRATLALSPAAQGGTLVSCILNEEMTHGH